MKKPPLKCMAFACHQSTANHNPPAVKRAHPRLDIHWRTEERWFWPNPNATTIVHLPVNGNRR